MAQHIETKQERPIQTYWLKQFLAVNTVSSRVAEPQDQCFYDLTNCQPIGNANLHSINDASQPIYDFTSHRVYADFNVNIGNQEYLLIATRDGNLYAYKVGSEKPGPVSVTQIGSGLSTDGSLDIAQYDNSTAVIVDNAGYYEWNGSGNIQNISGGIVAGGTITNGGTGYTSPTVTFTGGGGTGAAATLTQTGGVIDSITMTNAGHGYTSAPTAVISGGGTGAAITITLGNAPQKGQAIAVYNNMVWIADGRELYYSKPGSSSDVPPGYADFSDMAGGGWTNMTDGLLRTDIKALFPANGYLYLFGESCIYAISNVYIITTGSAATANFTILNISAVIGTEQPESIMAYGRLIFFANQMGVWLLYGTTVQLASTDVQNSYASGIDGTWQYLDWQHYNDAVQWINNSGDQVEWQNNAGSTVLWQFQNYTPFLFRISGGQVRSNNLLCAAFNVVRKNDPIMGSGNFIALYWGDASGGSYKWWFMDETADIGPITHVCTAFVNNAPALFGYINNVLYQFFADPTSAPSARIMTALWDFNDPLTDKQALRAGIRVSLHGNANPAMLLNIDTLTGTYPVKLGDIGTVDWVNDTEALVPWQNTAAATVKWQNWRNFLIYFGKAPQCYGKNIGFTVRSQRGSQFELNAFLLDYKIGPRWIGN